MGPARPNRCKFGGRERGATCGGNALESQSRLLYPPPPLPPSSFLPPYHCSDSLSPVSLCTALLFNQRSPASLLQCEGFHGNADLPRTMVLCSVAMERERERARGVRLINVLYVSSTTLGMLRLVSRKAAVPLCFSLCPFLSKTITLSI